VDFIFGKTMKSDDGFLCKSETMSTSRVVVRCAWWSIFKIILWMV